MHSSSIFPVHRAYAVDRLRALDQETPLRRHYEVFATTGVSLAGGRLSQGGRCTGSGCASWCFRSSVICQGRKAERSGGVLPPWATQASKNALNQWRGLSPHTSTVWSTLNIIAARCALQMLP